MNKKVMSVHMIEYELDKREATTAIQRYLEDEYLYIAGDNTKIVFNVRDGGLSIIDEFPSTDIIKG